MEVYPTLAAIPEAVVQPFADRLLRRNIRVGLVVTPTETVVVRHALTGAQLGSEKYSVARLATDALLVRAGLGSPPAGEPFVRQVSTWLEAIGSSWYSFLHESAIPSMVPDVVGNLAGADLEIWDGLLEAYDAAE